MKIIYITDVHGYKDKYWWALESAKENGATAVVNGGDMLPKEGDLHRSQRDFVDGFLNQYFSEFEKAGIYHIGYLGNDDLKIHDESFQKVCSKYPHVVDLAQRRFQLDSFEFIGMNWVVDYPFQLKDRCRKDTKDYVLQRQLGPGLLSTERGFQTLPDWFSFASTLPTIEDELDILPKPKNKRKAIYVIHMPPANVGLDVCWSGEKVGSQAIYEFIEKNQPLLTLHGHIHESPAKSGVWKAKVGKTISVQPGQLKPDSVSYVIIDLAKMKLDRFDERLAN
jgi:Icc-related predicted phosphoesterase